MCFFFFKQKTAYEMRISDWSSDVCSSDLILSAASSSVGLAAIQIAIQRGAIPVATTRLPHKKQRLLDAGAHDVIVTQEEDLAARLEIGRASCRERGCQDV